MAAFCNGLPYISLGTPSFGARTSRSVRTRALRAKTGIRVLLQQKHMILLSIQKISINANGILYFVLYFNVPVPPGAAAVGQRPFGGFKELFGKQQYARQENDYQNNSDQVFHFFSCTI
jgi:hypothetical protein